MTIFNNKFNYDKIFLIDHNLTIGVALTWVILIISALVCVVLALLAIDLGKQIIYGQQGDWGVQEYGAVIIFPIKPEPSYNLSADQIYSMLDEERKKQQPMSIEEFKDYQKTDMNLNKNQHTNDTRYTGEPNKVNSSAIYNMLVDPYYSKGVYD